MRLEASSEEVGRVGVTVNNRYDTFTSVGRIYYKIKRTRVPYFLILLHKDVIVGINGWILCRIHILKGLQTEAVAIGGALV